VPTDLQAVLLVSGSRKHGTGTEHIIRLGLIEAGRELGRDTLLIHGAAGGADRISALWWTRWGLLVEAFPADWAGPCVESCKPGHRRADQGREYCPDAGHRRNQVMVDWAAGMAELGSRVLVVGFPYPGQSTGGTFDCLRRARKAGLPDPWVRSDPNVGRRAG
jgi:hypothetical protein